VKKKFFGLYIVHDPKYHDLRARGQWAQKFFFAFSILLDGLAHISAIFLLKMQKKSKIGSPYWAVINYIGSLLRSEEILYSGLTFLAAFFH
jgi:hypothetical protein